MSVLSDRLDEDERRLERLESCLTELHVKASQKVVALSSDGLPGGLCVMTLRDYFAGQALAGLVTHLPPIDPEDHEIVVSARLQGDAQLTYRIADAMLAAREVKP
jgi:hypothetical protein